MSTLMDSVVRFCDLRDLLELARTSARWREVREIARVIDVVHDIVRGGAALDKINIHAQIATAYVYSPMNELTWRDFIQRSTLLFRYADLTHHARNMSVVIFSLSLPITGKHLAGYDAESIAIAVKSVITGIGHNLRGHFEYLNRIAADHGDALSTCLMSAISDDANVESRFVEFIDCIIDRDMRGAGKCIPEFSDVLIETLIKSDKIRRIIDHPENFKYGLSCAVGPKLARVFVENRKYLPIIGHFAHDSRLYLECIANMGVIPTDPPYIDGLLSAAAVNSDEHVFDDICAILERSHISVKTCDILWNPFDGYGALNRIVNRLESRGICVIFNRIMTYGSKQYAALSLYDDVFEIMKLILSHSAIIIANSQSTGPCMQYLARFAKLFGTRMERLILSYFVLSPRARSDIFAAMKSERNSR